MKQKLLLATKNQHKKDEMAHLLGANYEILTLLDFPEIKDIEETGLTFESNALLKARTLFKLTGSPTIADDSGLSVNALDYQPGIYSARYAGSEASDADNRALLLSNLEGMDDRSAFFTCCIVYIDPIIEKTFTGILNGSIAHHEKGTNGFGYDAIFIPEEDTRTLAEYEAFEKNKISHRSLAVQQLLTWIANHH